ncbi:MAG: hypothetical protein PHS44_03750 [Candidatus Dojkabacteria bacterium]|nr:hypothetical protein [Candidatus Dojkabacteria bacterium]
MGKLQLVKTIFWILSINVVLFMVANSYFVFENKVTTVQLSHGPITNEDNWVRLYAYKDTNNKKITPLKLKYQQIAGKYYVKELEPYLADIEKVLTKRGYDFDEKLIKGMFYVGQQESHWTPWRVASNEIGGGHPTGIFQFLPGTFMSVSDGNIFKPEDQIDAFITMYERGRIDEFAVMFACNYEPCLEADLRNYLLRS